MHPSITTIEKNDSKKSSRIRMLLHNSQMLTQNDDHHTQDTRRKPTARNEKTNANLHSASAFANYNLQFMNYVEASLREC